jgi:hypothetical protein
VKLRGRGGKWHRSLNRGASHPLVHDRRWAQNFVRAIIVVIVRRRIRRRLQLILLRQPLPERGLPVDEIVSRFGRLALNCTSGDFLTVRNCARRNRRALHRRFVERLARGGRGREQIAVLREEAVTRGANVEGARGPRPVRVVRGIGRQRRQRRRGIRRQNRLRRLRAAPQHGVRRGGHERRQLLRHRERPNRVHPAAVPRSRHKTRQIVHKVLPIILHAPAINPNQSINPETKATNNHLRKRCSPVQDDVVGANRLGFVDDDILDRVPGLHIDLQCHLQKARTHEFSYRSTFKGFSFGAHSAVLTPALSHHSLTCGMFSSTLRFI